MCVKSFVSIDDGGKIGFSNQYIPFTRVVDDDDDDDVHVVILVAMVKRINANVSN
jgi:hypothetical protein